jgi:hypothetical protein
VISEFKLNVADIWRWKDQPDALRAMLAEPYNQICIAYSLWNSQDRTGYAEALLIGETLFPACESIFPLHVYQPGITPTDHIVYILRIGDLDSFVDKLQTLGDLFAANADANTRNHAVEALLGSHQTHFSDLKQQHDALQSG